MRKTVSAVICFVLVFTLAGCGGNGAASHKNGKSGGVQDVLNDIVNGDNPSPTATPAGNTDKPSGTPKPTMALGTDGIDLTQMSDTMAFSQVYNMLVDPDSYLGLNVRMKGQFDCYQDPDSGKYYFACVVMDETQCCNYGIEFELEGDHHYPEDYPQLGEEFCVSGEFSTYTEEDQRYATLINARLE